MPEQALTNLLEIMQDQRVGMRDRLNAAISASRVSPVALGDESEPESVAFLRHVITAEFDNGARFSPQFRREAAAAVSYFERRCRKAELTYEVADRAQQQREWHLLVNASLRRELALLGHWPQHRNILFRADEFQSPPDSSERTLTATLMPAIGATQRKRRALDDPGRQPTIANEAERRRLLAPIKRAVHQRLVEFGLA